MDRIERRAAVDAVEKLASERINELPNGLANTIYAALNTLPPARFTREDVEKAAKAIALNRYRNFSIPVRWPDSENDVVNDRTGRSPLTWDYANECRHMAEAALAAIGGVDHG